METRADRRRYARSVRLWSGRLIAGGVVVDCAISNESVKGLKLITETGISLPVESLLELPDGTTHRCFVRWQRLNEVGVSLAGLYRSPDHEATFPGET